jgi:hypothetical protein
MQSRDFKSIFRYLIDVRAEIYDEASQYIGAHPVAGTLKQRLPADQTDTLTSPSSELSSIAPLARLDDRGDWNLNPGRL